MISARESHEYVPFGRQSIKSHPGSRPHRYKGSCADHGLPLVKALNDISLREIVKDGWKIRRCDDESGSEEELYISELTVVWSRGLPDATASVIKSFTVDSPVQDALWCTFLLPVDDVVQNPPLETDMVDVQLQKGVCVVEQGIVSIFTIDGRDYVTALPFPVKTTWPIKNGLLFERATQDNIKDSLKTPKKGRPNLPVLFSMLHPLDEVAPVICKTGGNTSLSKVAFVTESSQTIVFTSEEPSLIMTYDRILGAHAVWTLRRAKPDEAFMACGSSTIADPYNSTAQNEAFTPGMSHLSHSSSIPSRLTLSSQSPSLSPFRSINFSSRVNSPVTGPSRVNSPSFSKLTALSRSQSPSVSAGSLYRLQTPSPQASRSPVGCPRTPISFLTSPAESSFTEPAEPLAPEVCMDHIWTEAANISRDGSIGQASKVFLSSDMCHQQYLCYLVPSRQHLRCVKIEESNDKTQLIFGSMSIIPARDAAPLKPLDMMLILDTTYSLILYSGSTRMQQLYVQGLPNPLTMSACGPAGLQSGTPFGSPIRMMGGPVTSSRPPSAMDGPVTSSRPPSAMDVKFDEEVQLLSPVCSDKGDGSLLDSSLPDISFQPGLTGGPVSALRDPVDNRVTLELIDGGMHRTSLPDITQSPIIKLCLEAVRQVLPRDTAMQVLIKWYCTHNAPGSVNGQSEWLQFTKCLMGLMGYDVDKLQLTQLKRTHMDNDTSFSPAVVAKKAKPSDQGCDEDWQYLLRSHHHQTVIQCQDTVLGLNTELPPQETSDPQKEQFCIDPHAPLFSHLPSLLLAFHLVYEELKLDLFYQQDLHDLGTLLVQMSCDLQRHLYVDHYCRDQPILLNNLTGHSLIQDNTVEKLHWPNFFPKEPPSIFNWLHRLLMGQEILPFPYMAKVSCKTKNVIALYVALLENELNLEEAVWLKYLRKVSGSGRRAPVCETPLTGKTGAATCTNRFERVVLSMVELGMTLKDSLVFGVALPLKEAIYHCRKDPPGDWPHDAYLLIGREDLARQTKAFIAGNRQAPSKDSGSQSKAVREEEDGMEYLDKELLQLRFSEDQRVSEVRRLLQSSRPVRVALTQKPEVSDHEFIEEQQRHLYAISIRTMALPLGRGMFTMCTYHPVPTEMTPIPKLNLTGRAPPRNTTVDLNSNNFETPANMTAWPAFHNGVAAGLRVADSSQVDTTWIMYNKPRSAELTNDHAGFLMGLGLNGHLSTVSTLSVHDYLLKNHEMTSVGLLLGLSAGRRGSMDVATTRLLSIHVAALLPPTSTELDVSHNIQVAAVLCVGLLYQGTAHRHMAEVLLSEIGRPPGPEMENCIDRESYSLAAGLSLGMVMFGRGNEIMGMSDLSMADHLYHYMVGGHKIPLIGVNKERYKSPSYHIKEGDYVNVDVTSTGATLALGMMFFNTNNEAVCQWLVAPDTQFLLEFVRPDFLMLRVVSRGLVMWDDIHPSEDWIDGNLPEIVKKYAFEKQNYRDDPNCDIDFETMSQAYCNLIAGGCMALALRFAGSANQPAFETLKKKMDFMLQIVNKPQMVEQVGRSSAENCLTVVLMSLAIIMAGTGNLEVLRLCRYLRSRVGPMYGYVLYGSHMAVSMSMGLLFLGGGRYTLSTKPEAIAAMLCAFFPKFPIHSNDNRYHLQAFRHLYVLAAEPRVMLPRDVDSGFPSYVPLQVKFKDTSDYKNRKYLCMAPCLLPELDLLDEVRVLGPRYWPIVFTSERNWLSIRQILHGSGYLYVKQRAGHLSYKEDPKGYHSVLSQCLTSDISVGKELKPEAIKSFSSDPTILEFAGIFCQSKHTKEYDVCQYLSRVLYECVSHEKPEILTTHLAMQQMIEGLCTKLIPLGLWQLKLISAYYSRNLDSPIGDVDTEEVKGLKLQRLISAELLEGAINATQQWLHDWLLGHTDILVLYLSGSGVGNRPEDGEILATFLAWHDVPHPIHLSHINYQQGTPSIPELYNMLRPYGLSVRAVMSIHTALKEQKENRSF